MQSAQIEEEDPMKTVMKKLDGLLPMPNPTVLPKPNVNGLRTCYRGKKIWTFQERLQSVAFRSDQESRAAEKLELVVVTQDCPNGPGS